MNAKPALIFTAIVAFLFSLAVIVLINQRMTPGNRSSNSQAFPQGNATISTVVNAGSGLQVGATVPVDVRISSATPINISAFSVRITYSYTNMPSYVPTTVVPAFSTADWLFPIKKISIDDKAKTVMVDISGINISTTGFNVSQETTVATVNFLVKSQISLLTLNLDKSETKLVTKDGHEVNLSFMNR